MKYLRVYCRLFLVLLMAGIVVPIGAVKASHSAQVVDTEELVLEMMKTMTPAEMAGQLFIVGFQGNDVQANAQLKDLIARYHIGGVVLKAVNHNFDSSDPSIQRISDMSIALQKLALSGSVTDVKQTSQPEASQTAQGIPLFIGISQEGNSGQNYPMMNGFTPLPNSITMGATWNPDYARQAGSVSGREMKTAGINLLLGPSLDVYEVTQTTNGKLMASQMFGGDPYWVGEMGAAYIQGVHQGSDGKVMVIARNFPGCGASDRMPEEEVATVRKSLEQLRQVELAPFFSVVQNETAESIADGLLVSHIRYQGFQGNIRATTKPISFDREALDQLLQLPGLSTWKENGGILMSDNLGSMAVRKMADPTLFTFDAVQIARNAFLAGNDLLYVDNFVANGDKDQYSTLIKVLDSFSTKYQEDPAFKKRVDESVVRILSSKVRLYDNRFETALLPPADSDLAEAGTSNDVCFEIVRNAVTLISPALSELQQALPGPPARGERVIFITDVETNKLCSTCQEQSTLAVNSIQRVVERLYSEQGGGQILKQYLSSYTYADLMAYLNNPGELLNISEDLKLADWIVFAGGTVSPARPESLALNRMLAERADLTQNKKVILFQFDAPLFLDATEISKVTAYYALYSKTAAATEVAARLLFQEIAPNGRLPVSVPEINYDLLSVTAPDSRQVIALYLDAETEHTASELSTPMAGGGTLQPTRVPNFKTGDTMPVRTGVILDRNGNPVPDGTVVRFLITVSGEKSSVQQMDTQTRHGIARIRYQITTPGLLEVKASSDPAMTSHLLRINIHSEMVAFITIVAPTPDVTESPLPAVTPTAHAEVQTEKSNSLSLSFYHWLISLLLIGLFSWAVYLFVQWKTGLIWAVRFAMGSALGGMTMYAFLRIFFPWLINWSQLNTFVSVCMLFMVGCGLGIGVIRLVYQKKRHDAGRVNTGELQVKHTDQKSKYG